jgi:hypothetical protein
MPIVQCHAPQITLYTTPAMVVPVFHAEGGAMPLLFSSALRLQRSKLNPPSFDPMVAVIGLLSASRLFLGCPCRP